MVDALEDKAVAASIPLDLRAPPPSVPLILQVSPLDGSSDLDKFFYNPFANIKSSNFAMARAFFIHHGHVVVFHKCPYASAFQGLFPLANIRYISALPHGLLAKGHDLLETQHEILCASNRTALLPPVTPPWSILDCYVAAGFAGSCGAPSASHTTASSFTSTPGSGLLHSPSVSARGDESSTVVALPQRHGHHPVGHHQSSPWRPDQDGYNHSSLGYYGGVCLAHGVSFHCYGGSGLPSRSSVRSYGARPSHRHGGQYGGPPSIHPRDVSPFIFQHHGVPAAPVHVLNAAALVASSLGDTVAPLSSLQHADMPPPLASDITMSFLVLQVPLKVLISHWCLAQFLPLWLMGGSLALFLHFTGDYLLPLLLLLRFHKVLLLFHWLL
jgi:hypothetical protein